MRTQTEPSEVRDARARGARARNVLSPYSHFALHVSFSGSSPRWIATMPSTENAGGGHGFEPPD